MGSAQRDEGWHSAREKELSELVRTASAHCALGEVGQTVRIETTMDEIVDVTAAPSKRASRQCLVEAVWSIRLTPRFDRATSFEIVVPRQGPPN